MFWRLLLVASITIFVGYKLQWINTPQFLMQESYGLAYVDNPSMGNLCDSNPLSGLEDQTNNVTDQRSSSLIYVIPAKLLRNSINLYTLNRILAVLFFCTTLIFFVATLSRLQVNSILIAFFIVYYGLSSQFLSYVFEMKLTVSSAAWLSILFFLFVIFFDYVYEIRNKTDYNSKILCVTFLIPLWILFAYETYAIARPYAFMYLILFPFLFYIISTLRFYRKLLLFIYFAGFISGMIVLKFAHPNMNFDVSIFNGRGEAFFGDNNVNLADYCDLLLERLKELCNLLKFPMYTLSSEDNNIGWLDIILANILIMPICIFLSAKNKILLAGNDIYRKYALIFFLLAALMITGIITPLLSISFVRGHRLLGFYFASSMMLVIFLQIIINLSAKVGRYFVLAGLVVISCVTVLQRVPFILGFQPNVHPDIIDTWSIYNYLLEFKHQNHLQYDPYSTIIKVCDKYKPALFAHSWHAVLYVSDLACQLGATRVLFDICDCYPGRVFNEKMEICINRYSVHGVSAIDILIPKK